MANKEKPPPYPPLPKLAAFMKKHGISQAKIGEMIGEYQNHVSQILSGHKRLRSDHIQGLIVGLGLHPMHVMRLIGLSASLADQAESVSAGGEGITNYRALADFPERGITRGAYVVVEAKKPLSGQTVLAVIGEAGSSRKYKMFFRFLEPNSLVANQAGVVFGWHTDDPEFAIEILGVVISVLAWPS